MENIDKFINKLKIEKNLKVETVADYLLTEDTFGSDDFDELIKKIIKKKKIIKCREEDLFKEKRMNKITSYIIAQNDILHGREKEVNQFKENTSYVIKMQDKKILIMDEIESPNKILFFKNKEQTIKKVRLDSNSSVRILNILEIESRKQKEKTLKEFADLFG